MGEALARTPYTDLLKENVSAIAAKVVRDARGRALAAGHTVTTHKDGRLVRERMVDGRVIELFKRVDEQNTD